VVWKSDFFGTIEAFALLDSVVDLYIADFKFGNNACAKQLSGVDNYAQTIGRNLMTASKSADLIVRHLLLPDHFECCFCPIVDWMASHLPTTKFSIRDGYMPKWLAKRDPQLGSNLSPGVGEQARLVAGLPP